MDHSSAISAHHDVEILEASKQYSLASRRRKDIVLVKKGAFAGNALALGSSTEEEAAAMLRLARAWCTR
jgi:hypothetical protein